MINVTTQTNSPIIEMAINGNVDKSDIEAFEETFKQKMTEQEPVNLLITVENMEGVTLKGLVEDLKMIRYIRSMKKAAVVTDTTWLKADAKLENLFPGVEVNYFTPDHAETAREWLKD
ncbi:hypothetical protein GCM10028778_21900 [Barrientosiimonas marina]|uniref:STAS/SEC14 domain-containing protein n=1 Tax=Lentibacillus kimchii TaxID=1542911 RepID=A0ABW2URS4_9BACI